jgi:hypothetical protein
MLLLMSDKDDRFDEEQTKRRFEAALRGARLAEPKPMKEIPPKRPKKRALRKPKNESGD